jgi:NAD(P)-dependent dehydrogenase (short-subunit alcohol dehydrogenase family)
VTDPVFPDLKGQSVFITGGGSGIGAALTEAFLRQGAKVAFCQRSDGTAFCDAMETATGNRPLFLPCDIGVTDQLQLTLATAAKAHGAITVLVNNAANDTRHKTLDTDQTFWDWSIAVNLRSYFFACQAVIPGMQAAGGGSIVNLASTSAFTASGSPMTAYDTSKGAVRMLTTTVARELAPTGIRVNAVAPGTIDTDLTRAVADTGRSLEDLAATRIPMGRIGVPADIAGAVAYLTSSAASYVTGHTLVVDGGWLT